MWYFKLKSGFGLILLFVGLSHCASIPVESTPPIVEPKKATPPQENTPVELSSDGEHLEVATPLAGIEKKFRKVGEMTSRLSEKAPELERLARFIFDLGGSNSNDGYTTSDGTTNLFNLNIDSARVMEGLFRPDYVAIHVAQNAFNFFTSSLAWVVASGLYETTNSGRGLFASNPDSYSSSSSGYTIPSYKSPSSSSNTYDTPSSSYGAPLLTSKSSFSNDPLSFLTKTIAGSSLFNAFSPNKPSKTAVNNYDYESRKIKLDEDNEAVSAEDPFAGMSVDQIQHLLEAEEKGQANMFSHLSEEQKYQMYQRAKNAMLTGSRRHEANGGEPSLTFLDNSSPSKETHPIPDDMELETGINVGNNKPAVRRRRKLIRKPLDQTPRKVEE